MHGRGEGIYGVPLTSTTRNYHATRLMRKNLEDALILRSIEFFRVLSVVPRRYEKLAMEPEANGDKESKTLLALKTKYEYPPTSTGTKSSGSAARPSPYACSPRRSSRIVKKEEHSATVQESVEEELVEQEMAVACPSKSSPSPKKKRRQGKRGYAPPETYAHLSNLTDCLKFELDGA